MLDFDQILNEETTELDKTLAKLLDEDLGEWDQDFVDSLVKKIKDHGNIKLTARQSEQVERLKEKYDG